MSTLSRYLRELFKPLIDELYDLLPRRCIVCGRALSRNQHGVCVWCYYDVPYTNNFSNHNSSINQTALSIEPSIKHVGALFYFAIHSNWQYLIHNFKYHNNWQYASTLGAWMGGELKKSEIYRAVDLVIAIPLHPIRQYSRGYNQSELLAKYIAQAMEVEYMKSPLVRVRNNRPQATRNATQRWELTTDLFTLPNPKLLENRNVLIVDDVYTTGATMLSAVHQISEACPSCNIFIATLSQTFTS